MKIEVKRKEQLLTITFKRIEKEQFTATAEIGGVPINEDIQDNFRAIWLDVGDQLILRIPIAGSFLDGTTPRSS